MPIILGIVGIIILAVGIINKFSKSAMSVSVIGGADGPTSIFLAGKVGSNFSLAGIILGIILVVIAVIIVMRKKK